ncbi:MAG: hypothetical protein IKT79_02210, partial [Akkermansia sp.]|nr:hypothetical protein [Akkermansia sp.]
MVEGKTLTYGGTGTLTVEGGINGNLNVTGGTLNLKGSDAITGSKLDIAGGTVFIDCDSGSSNTSAINKNTVVSIGAGGKLHIKGHDSMGWGSQHGTTLASILLKGTDADNIAELVLEDSSTTWGGKNSIGYELNMQGYSAVTGINGNNLIPGASVTASGVGNSITFDFLQVSHAWNVTVNQGGQLTIHATSTGTAADRKQTIIKMGTGELTLTGSYNSAVDVQGGTMVVGSTGRLAGAISVADGATFEIATNDAAHNGTVLTRTTGSGDIVLSSDTRVSSGSTSVFSGTLTMRNAALLDLSDDTNDNAHKNDTYNLTSIKSVVLDNASIEYRGQSTSLKNVTVKSGGATLNVKDLSDISHKFTLSETTNLQGKLTINNGQWKSHVQIDKLTGTGAAELVVNMGKDNTDKMTIKSFDQYAGKVTLNNQGKNPAYNFGLSAADVLNFAAGSSVTNAGTLNIYGALTGNTSISGGTINLKNGASVGGTISFGSSVNMEGTLANTGNLTLAGLNVNSIDHLVYIPSGESEAEYSAGANGYLASSYYVIQNSEEGTLTANNLSGYTFAGSVLAAENGKFSQDSDGSLLLTLTGAGLYYVNTVVTYGGDDASPGVANASGIVINDGGVLNLNKALASGMTSGITVADNAEASIAI